LPTIGSALINVVNRPREIAGDGGMRFFLLPDLLVPLLKLGDSGFFGWGKLG
jgi:hypothetical protein